MPPSLPINGCLPQLMAALAAKQTVVLAAPPGSGKTTGVPLALLDAPWLANGSILILEPRRLAARLAAVRMAELLGEPVGHTVGYRVRFDSQVSAGTRIEVLTEGILTRRLQSDPELRGVKLVIFDEFHERSIHADLALALCLDVINGLRDDLKVLIMSATLDLERLSGFLHDPEVVIGEGRSYPVTLRYRPDHSPPHRGQTAGGGYIAHRLSGSMAAAIVHALVHEQGDILAFLPGIEEIRRCAAHLASDSAAIDADILPLYGDLPKVVQDRTVRYTPGGKRRVILATSIAETSLTIEGVRVVIDSGWTRTLRFDPNRGLSQLVTVRVSQAAAEQRRGRAGRLCEGVCYRLWGEHETHTLPAHGRPEILDADLAPLALDLAAWGVSSPAALRWLDPPPAGHYAGATNLLALLGGIDKQGRITPLGKRMSQLPVHPRLARMILSAGKEEIALACDLAALLTERDCLLKSGTLRTVDIDTRLQALAAFRRGDAAALSAFSADHRACAPVDAAARQLGRLRAVGNPQHSRHHPAHGGLLALAYPDRIAQLRPGTHNRYLLASGRGARLPDNDTLCGRHYLVAAHLDAGQSEGRMYLAAEISVDEIRQRLGRLILTDDAVVWDEGQDAVVSRRQERLFGLVLGERPLSSPEPEATCSALLDGVRRLGLAALPWNAEARGVQSRVESMRFWQPDRGWPNLSDQYLASDLTWLIPYLNGLSRRQHLARLDLAAILRSFLDWEHLQRLNVEAPTHLLAPSGSRLPLRYAPGEPPVLAVRLQEMFGLAETPRVAHGQVPVTLHLLSPAQRPIQITQDLRGFWNSTYPEVKKELKGRYPKHVWPDDPWSAQATARVQRRSK